VLLDRNPLITEPEQITDIRVLATVADGRATFEAKDSPFQL
jgi:predicted amidohydrolase YtcJ